LNRLQQPRPPRRKLSATVAPKIISRHWHDSSDQKISQVPAKKPRSSKKGSPVVDRKPVLEADACKSDGLDRMKRLFNPALHCKTSD
jgi:hypothetical protein